MKVYYAGDNEIIDEIPSAPLHLVSVGKNIEPPADYAVVREKGRRDYHLLYAVKGEFCVVFEGKSYPVKAGDLVLYPPHSRQEYTFFADKKASSYYLHFGGSDAENILKQCSLSYGVYAVGVSEDAESVFARLIVEHSLAHPDKSVAESGLLLTLFSLLGRLKRGKEQQTFDKRLETVLIAMSKTDAPLTLVPYAEMLGVSVNRLIHLFRSCIGVSPLQYLTDRKIEHAKRFLSDSSCNVAQTATALGYDDPMYFSRLFRKKTGLSPSQYRNRIR